MIAINGNELSIGDVEKVARKKEKVILGVLGQQAIKISNDRLQKILQETKPIYGINTGFGVFADKKISLNDIALLNRNLIISHAVGVGQPLPEEIVRAAMVIRANTLSKGYSGVRVEIVQTLLDMLNEGVTPVIPEQGSLGSSGDLCPLSHLALVMTTDDKDMEEESGQAIYNGVVMSGKVAMQSAGISRIKLGPKEGLALNNGATFTAAIASLVLADCTRLLQFAEAALAMSLESMLGCRAAFDERIHDLRGHPGQIQSARNIRELTEGSTLLDSAGRVQDAYSLRCAPQVHGSARDILEFVRTTVEREINAVTDNPILVDDGVALSGGNFHGEPIGLAMDYLAIAICEIAAISERRVFRLMDANLNSGLPGMLVDEFSSEGLNSGLMMLQYTAAALVLENQTLATPDSIRSLPTSSNQEDHNANSYTASRHTRSIVLNTFRIIGIEMYTAARALDLRIRKNPGYQMGKGTANYYELIRKQVPYRSGDALWGKEVDQIVDLILTEEK